MSDSPSAGNILGLKEVEKNGRQSKATLHKPKISKVKLLLNEDVLSNCKKANSGKTTKCNSPTGEGTCKNRIFGS